MTEPQHTKLSKQAVGALMMALQKSLLEQADIVPMLKSLKFKEAGNSLFIMNPPIVKFGLEEVKEEDVENA